MGQSHPSPMPRQPAPPDNTFRFPFFDDVATTTYVCGAKVMFLLRGLPGSGKTELAKKLKATFRNAVLCSADYYFSRGNGGTYQWDPRLLGPAHRKCQARAEKACRTNGTNVVVVDNTNIRFSEMEFYTNLANETNFIVVVVVPKTPWKFDPLQLAARNDHGVSLDVLVRKKKEWEAAIPQYYGWFIHETDSLALDSIAGSYLSELARSRAFWSDFTFYAPNARHDLHGFFQSHGVNDDQSILHCTANYCGTADKPGDVDYAKRQEVRNACGKAYSLQVVGFLVTPRTFGARIKLGRSALTLWNQDDDERPRTTAGFFDLAHSMEHLNLTDKMVSKSQKQRQRRSLCNTTLHWSQDQNDPAYKFRPTRGRGSRAHLTLGCSGTTQPVQTGLDLIELVQCEKRANQNVPSPSFRVHKGIAASHGDGLWAIYLDRPIIVQALFSCYYQDS